MSQNKRPSLFYPGTFIQDKKSPEVPVSSMPSLLSPNHDNEIAKMRDAAFKAEMRKYFRLEAKGLFKQRIQDIATQEGTSVEELMKNPDEPSGGVEKVASVIHAVGVTFNALVSIPYLIILLSLQGLVIFITVKFIYAVMFGIK